MRSAASVKGESSESSSSASNLTPITGSPLTDFMNSESLSLVPQPEIVEPHPGFWEFTSSSKIGVQAVDDEVPPAVKRFVKWLHSAAGEEFVLFEGLDHAQIRIYLDLERSDLNVEGYELLIGENGIDLIGYREKGLHYGLMTLRQLFPHEFEAGDGSQTLPVFLPRVRILDRPRFSWRGLSLDCCRHFVEPDYIHRLLELLAYHKLNVFHWHLTEDQGWRLEIERYPRLTEVAAFRGSSKYGGFYTKAQVKAIVAHADELGILVVPEIELPGHCSAALAAYPELSCLGKSGGVPETWGVFKDIYCAGNDKVFEFLEGVLEEVLDLFPSPYIHIGGDEAPKDRWGECEKCQAVMQAEGLDNEKQLQTYFIHRIGRFLQQKGRRIIGWDEIAEGGVPAGAILQHWRFGEHLETALNAGHQVISSNIEYCYFDYPYYKYADGTTDPPGKRDWMRATTADKSYQYDPLAGIDPKHHDQMIGGEAAMWLEFAPQQEIDRQLWPRLSALAEAFWTRREELDVAGFNRRLWNHCDRLGEMGVDYYPWLLREKRR